MLRVSRMMHSIDASSYMTRLKNPDGWRTPTRASTGAGQVQHLVILSLQFLWQAQHLVILLLQFSLLLRRGRPTENKTLRTPIQRSINSDQGA